MEDTDGLIAARAAAIVDRHRERAAAAEADLAWWPMGLVMFGLGLASGFSWWLLAQLPGFAPLPRILG